ncbi:MAG TPA: hypothetical protein DCL63_09130 [Firmicutes bacterium]|jgi:hypothetical protein|nr:hypothetical protein [Bacillota bacterium]HBK60711.1 hypothetical protein [Bacillota bacterium]
MFKRSILVIAALVLVLGVASVSLGAPAFKIGIVTGTVSQGEDEYRGAEYVVAKYPGMLEHRTYPDNFMAEQETYIAQITGLAADPAIKAIVVNQGVPGTVAAIRKVKQLRPDILFVIGEPHEDPPIVEKEADISLIPNNPARGQSIPQLAKKLGAKKFLHYSFPRHMSMNDLATRRDLMEQECKKLGMEFIFVTAPDPMGEGGLPAAQQFILEDVPRQVAKHGKDIAFFSTNCGMQEPLITAILKAGAIFPEQCCPSPTHGYPGALGLEITEELAGNFPAIVKAINTDIVKRGMAGRMATWPVATSYLNTVAGVEIAKLALEKKINIKDMAAVQKVVEEIAGVSMKFERNSEKGQFYRYLVGSIIFGKDVK